MHMLWFYIVIVLAISDTLHSHLVWKVVQDFYIILAGLIHNTVRTPMKTWLSHEVIEACFHFIVLSIVFLNLEIGILAAFIHFVLDITHTLFLKDMNTIEHRAFHFLIESLFFIAIFGF